MLTSNITFLIFAVLVVRHSHCHPVMYSDLQPSFVRSFFAGMGPDRPDRSALRPYSGPVHFPRDRKRIGRCVRCVLATCREGGLSSSEQLVGYFYSAPLLDVVYCLA